MIDFTTEPGPSEDVTIINEGSSGITEMLAALTALVLIALASIPLIELQQWSAETSLSAGTAHSAAERPEGPILPGGQSGD